MTHINKRQTIKREPRVNATSASERQYDFDEKTQRDKVANQESTLSAISAVWTPLGGGGYCIGSVTVTA